MNHTPGEWFYEIGIGCVAVFARQPYPQADCGTADAVVMLQQGRGKKYGDYYNITDEQKANVMLMAASPEMAEALRRLLRHRDKLGGGCGASDDVAFAEWVLAKAKGENK